MVSPSITLIADIIEEHFEELQFLWGQRQSLIRSPRYTLRELLALEERIDAHVQGLLVASEGVVPLIEGALAGDDPLVIFATGYVLLRIQSPAANEKVLNTFRQAEGPKLDAVQEALSQAPVTSMLPQLREMVSGAPPRIGAATAEVLGRHKKLDLKPEQMDRFLKHEDTVVRQAGWRATALSIPRRTEVYEAGMRDDDSAVQREALLAAAWGRQQWLLDHLRKLTSQTASTPVETAMLLAILGKPQDLPRILSLANTATLGPERFRVLGAFGHSGVMETLLKATESTDPLTAVTAGAAFAKITGKDIDSGKRVTVPPKDGSTPDDFEKEFLDELTLPSPDQARSIWTKMKDQFSKGTRWCRGLDLTKGCPAEVMAQLDLESRCEACLRGKFEGTWQGSAGDLEAFPQKPL